MAGAPSSTTASLQSKEKRKVLHRVGCVCVSLTEHCLSWWRLHKLLHHRRVPSWCTHCRDLSRNQSSLSPRQYDYRVQPSPCERKTAIRSNSLSRSIRGFVYLVYKSLWICSRISFNLLAQSSMGIVNFVAVWRRTTVNWDFDKSLGPSSTRTGTPEIDSFLRLLSIGKRDVFTFHFPIVELPTWWIIVSVVTVGTDASLFQFRFDVFASIQQGVFICCRQRCRNTAWNDDNLKWRIPFREARDCKDTYLIASDAGW